MNLELGKTCRTCLKNDGVEPLESLHLENQSKTGVIEFFTRLTNLEYHKNDGLPQNLCQTCIGSLVQAFSFAKLCRSSDSVARLKVKEATVQGISHKCQSIDDVKPESTKFEELEDETVEYKPNDVMGNSELAIEEDTIEGLTLDSNDCSLESPVDAKKKHICEFCSKEFAFRSYLVDHVKRHTGERPFLCSTCGKGFRQSGQLMYHTRTHTGFRPHVCTICKAGFTTKSVLRVHVRRHVNERPYVCTSCGMAFHQSTDLRAHTKTHTGAKRPMCSICGKLMSTIGQLNVHLRSHTGEKPHACSWCDKRFTTRGILTKHVRVHTGERPYTCHVCGRGFAQSGTLNTHLKTHKKGEDSGSAEKEVKVYEGVSVNVV